MTAIWGPILLHVFIVIWSGLVVLPLCRLVFEDVRRVALFSVSLSGGIPLTLTAFTLLARLNPNYAVAVPVLLIGGTITTTLLWFYSFRVAKDQLRLRWDMRADGLILGLGSLLLLATITIRTNWPSIFWDNILNHNGSEKLFNFSMIQAFVFGQGFPPENVWNLGERIDYYILLHTLPGLAAWGWRMLSGDPGAGGILFVFSDAFLLVWGSLALMSWGYSLLTQFSPTLTRRQALTIAGALGIGVFLSVHTGAVSRVFMFWFRGAPFGGWRSLQDYVIPWTVTQYPVWTLIQGDHHAFQRVFFLQISLVSSLILLLGAKRFHPPRIILTAILAAAVLLAHPGSVMIDVLIGGPATVGVLLLLLQRREISQVKIVIANIFGTGLLAGGISLPRLLEIQPTVTEWYWVEGSSASPFLGFLSAQSAPLLFLMLAAGSVWSPAQLPTLRLRWIPLFVGTIVLAVIGVKVNVQPLAAVILGSGIAVWLSSTPIKDGPRTAWATFVVRGSTLLSIVALTAAGRPAAGLALGCAWLVLATAPRSTTQELTVTTLGASLFLIWLLPEFLVVESPVFGNGPGKRFNVTMRFWLEGYYLIPFLAILAWSPRFPSLLSRPLIRRLYGGIAILLATLWLSVHSKAIADRIATTGDQPRVNGAAILNSLAPHDAEIVRYLQRLSGTVHIGELCGTGDVIPNLPSHYDWPGRIAAFSGRPGLCGWTRHVWQVGTRLRNPAPTGEWSWVRFREYERNLNAIYTAALSNTQAPASREFLQKLGITHLIIGDGELRFFPTMTPKTLANAVGGEVVFEGKDNTGVIAFKADIPT